MAYKLISLNLVLFLPPLMALSCFEGLESCFEILKAIQDVGTSERSNKETRLKDMMCSLAVWLQIHKVSARI